MPKIDKEIDEETFLKIVFKDTGITSNDNKTKSVYSEIPPIIKLSIKT